MIRRRFAGERGMTLVELVVAMSMLSVVLLVFTSVLASVQRAVVVNQRFSEANDQARLALQQLDRELRSGNVISDPADAIAGFTDAPAYHRLLIYTQTNLPTRGQAQCELWKVTDGGDLQARRWVPGSSSWATAWRTVATGLVNREAGGTNTFELNPDALKGDRTVEVVLQVNPDHDAEPDRTIELRASLTGRNTSYNYPTNICQTLPTEG